MIKKILLSLVVLVLIAGGGTYFYFGSLLASGIERAGTQVLGTDVSLSSASLSPLSGSAHISGLNVANPEGWEAESVFQLGELAIELDVNSLFSDVIEINSIVITEPDITYETKITSDNIRDLIANIPGGGSGEQPAAEGSAATAKKLIIRDFRLNGAKVELISAIGSAPVTLPDLHLTNIGDQSNAVTVAEASRQILGSINRAVLNSDLPSLDALRDNVEQRLTEEVEKVEEAVAEKVEEVQSRLRGLIPN